MKNVFCLTLTAACGGGPDGGTSIPVLNPAPVPASNSSSDLLAFVSEGTESTNADGVVTVSRNYAGGSVSYQSITGSNAGLLNYTGENGTAEYRVNGTAVPNIVVGSAGYNGPMEMSYRTSANGPYSVATGEFNAVVDFNNSTVAIGGIAGNGQNNIEIFGDTAIVNGAVSDTDTVIRLRDGQGQFITDYEGSIDGIFTNGDNGLDAIVGTVSASDTNFDLHGGFIATENQ